MAKSKFLIIFLTIISSNSFCKVMSLNIDLYEGVTLQETFHAAKSEQSISSDAECGEGELALPQKLLNTLIPGRKCDQKVIKDTKYRGEFYCNCMADNTSASEIITAKDYKEVTNNILKEAKSINDNYVKVKLQLLKNKVKNSIEAYSKYKNTKGYSQLNCNPKQLIANFNEATLKCSKGDKRKIDELAKAENTFAALSSTFEGWVKEFSNKEYPSNILSIDDQKLGEMINLLHDSNIKERSEKEIEDLSFEVGKLLAENPLLRHYHLKLQDKNEKEKYINHMLPGYEDIGDIRLGYSTSMLPDMMVEVDDLNEIGLDNKAAVSLIIEDRMLSSNIFCKNIKNDVNDICNNASSISSTMLYLQENPKYIGKVILEQSGKKQNTQISKENENVLLAQKINLYQCTFNDPKYIQKYSGESSSSETEAIAEIIKNNSKYRESNWSSNQGLNTHSNDINYSKKLSTYDPKESLKNAASSLQLISSISDKTNNLKTEDSTDFVSDIARPSSDYNYDKTTNYIRPNEDYSFVTSTTTETTATTKMPNVPTERKKPAIDDAAQSLSQANYSPTSTPIVQNSSSIATDEQSKPTKKATTSANIEDLGQLEKYEAKMEELIAKAAELTAKKQKTKENGKQSEETDEQAELEGKIDALKAEIKELSKTKKTKTAQKVEKRKNNTTLLPFNNEIKGNSPINKSAATTAAQATRVHTPTQASASTQSSSSAADGSSQENTKVAQGVSQRAVGQTGQKSSFTLRADKVNLEGKFTIHESEFKTNDKQVMSKIYENANGFPVYVTRTLPDGTEEVIIYELIKDDKGNITYQASEAKDLIDKSNGEKETLNIENTRTPASGSRKIKVDELNNLLDQKL